MSDLKIVGGKLLGPNARSPAVGIVFPHGRSDVSEVRVCSATHLGDKKFLTSSACLADFQGTGRSTLTMVSANGRAFEVDPDETAHHPQPTFDLALFTIRRYPEGFLQAVSRVAIDFGPVAVGLKIAVIGAGCLRVDGRGDCEAAPVAPEGLAGLETRVALVGDDEQWDDRFFFSDPTVGHIAPGDEGGGVFSMTGGVMTLRGISHFATSRAERRPAYLWLGLPDVRDFIESTRFKASNQGTLAEDITSQLRLVFSQLSACGFRTNELAIFQGQGFERDSRAERCPAEVTTATRDGWYRLQVFRLMLLDEARRAELSGDEQRARILLEQAKKIGLILVDLGASLLLGDLRDGAECLTRTNLVTLPPLSRHAQFLACASLILGNRVFWSSLFDALGRSALARHLLIDGKRGLEQVEGWRQVLDFLRRSTTLSRADLEVLLPQLWVHWRHATHDLDMLLHGLSSMIDSLELSTPSDVERLVAAVAPERLDVFYAKPEIKRIFATRADFLQAVVMTMLADDSEWHINRDVIITVREDQRQRIEIQFDSATKRIFSIAVSAF